MDRWGKTPAVRQAASPEDFKQFTLSSFSPPTIGSSTRVCKDECLVTLNVDDNLDGFFVSMKTLNCYALDALPWATTKRADGPFYLRIKNIRIFNQSQNNQPDKVALNVHGGFDESCHRYKLEVAYDVGIYLSDEILICPCDDARLPEDIQSFAAQLIAKDSTTLVDDVTKWEEDIHVSKYATELLQTPSPPKIPTEGWECQDCGATKNLWLNLSDGYIGCGRKIYSVGGGCRNGTEGAALRHFEEGKKDNPLCVKLGTITPNNADVFSYAPDENDMVKDPKLAQHLNHFGIRIQQLGKTERSVAELEVERNLNLNLTDADNDDHTPLNGPGLVGMKNLGNTCYINSVMQLLASIPEVESKMQAAHGRLLETLPPDTKLHQNVMVQSAKLFGTLKSCRIPDQTRDRNLHYGGSPHPEDLEHWITPRMLRTVVTSGHAEFSTSRQQDAEEFFSYYFTLLAQAEKTASQSSPEIASISGGSLVSLLHYEQEHFLQCQTTKKVRYTVVPECHIVGLDVPRDSHGAPLSPTASPLTIENCFQTWGAENVVEMYFSDAAQCKGKAITRNRFKSFPPYLMVHLRRFYCGPDWTAAKVDIPIQVGDEIDIENLRAPPRDPTAELLDSEEEGKFDENMIAGLVAMGFGENASKRASRATESNSAELCLNWLIEHMEDPDLNSPLGGKEEVVSPEALITLQQMGFEDKYCKAALKANNNDPDAAVNWLFAHTDQLETMSDQILGATKNQAPTRPDGIGKYDLVGFVSHLGKNACSGHYVCHVKKENRWVLYNDNRVAGVPVSPNAKGYLYLFKRKDWNSSL